MSGGWGWQIFDLGGMRSQNKELGMSDENGPSLKDLVMALLSRVEREMSGVVVPISSATPVKNMERELARVRDALICETDALTLAVGDLERARAEIANTRRSLSVVSGDLDRALGEIAAVNLVLDRAGVDAFSFAGTRVEILVKQRDDLSGRRGDVADEGDGGAGLARAGMDADGAGDAAPGCVTWRMLISELGRLILQGSRSSAALDQPVAVRLGESDDRVLLRSVDIEDGAGTLPALVMRADVPHADVARGDGRERGLGVSGNDPERDRYYHFQCLDGGCGYDAVVDVRKRVDLGASADFVTMSCPFCSTPMDYSGSSPADDDGYMIRRSAIGQSGKVSP